MRALCPHAFTGMGVRDFEKMAIGAQSEVRYHAPMGIRALCPHAPMGIRALFIGNLEIKKVI